jgi:hypothetical protein
MTSVIKETFEYVEVFMNLPLLEKRVVLKLVEVSQPLEVRCVGNFSLISRKLLHRADFLFVHVYHDQLMQIIDISDRQCL